MCSLSFQQHTHSHTHRFRNRLHSLTNDPHSLERSSRIAPSRRTGHHSTQYRNNHCCIRQNTSTDRDTAHSPPRQHHDTSHVSRLSHRSLCPKLSYSKSDKRERGLTQKPARDRDELFKIRQETEMSYSKSGKRQRWRCSKSGNRMMALR